MLVDPFNIIIDDDPAIFLRLIVQLVVVAIVQPVLLVRDLNLVEEVMAGFLIGQMVRRAMADQNRHFLGDLLVTVIDQCLAIRQHVVQSQDGTIPMDQKISVVLDDLIWVAGNEHGLELGGDLERWKEPGSETCNLDGWPVGARRRCCQNARCRGDQS